MYIAGNSFRNTTKRRDIPSNFAGGKPSRNALISSGALCKGITALHGSIFFKRQRLIYTS